MLRVISHCSTPHWYKIAAETMSDINYESVLRTRVPFDKTENRGKIYGFPEILIEKY